MNKYRNVFTDEEILYANNWMTELNPVITLHQL